MGVAQASCRNFRFSYLRLYPACTQHHVVRNYSYISSVRLCTGDEYDKTRNQTNMSFLGLSTLRNKNAEIKTCRNFSSLRTCTGHIGYHVTRDTVKVTETSRTKHALSPHLLSSCQPGIQQTRNFMETFRWMVSDDFYGTKLAAAAFNSVHDLTGLPWWASVILTTVLVRATLGFSLFIYLQREMAKLNIAHKREIMPFKYLTERGKEGLMKKQNMTLREADEHIYKEVQKFKVHVYRRDNTHPGKMIVMLGNIPLWLSMSFALRHLAGFAPFSRMLGNRSDTLFTPEMTTGGTLWFPDLTIPDPLFILPVIYGFVMMTLMLASTHAMPPMMLLGKYDLRKIMKYNGIFWSLVVVPIAALCPSCMTLFWVSSITLGYGQSFLLRVPRVREFFGIPDPSKVQATPEHLSKVLMAYRGERPSTAQKEPRRQSFQR